MIVATLFIFYNVMNELEFYYPYIHKFNKIMNDTIATSKPAT